MFTQILMTKKHVYLFHELFVNFFSLFKSCKQHPYAVKPLNNASTRDDIFGHDVGYPSTYPTY